MCFYLKLLHVIQNRDKMYATFVKTFLKIIYFLIKCSYFTTLHLINRWITL